MHSKPSMSYYDGKYLQVICSPFKWVFFYQRQAYKDLKTCAFRNTWMNKCSNICVQSDTGIRMWVFMMFIRLHKIINHCIFKLMFLCCLPYLTIVLSVSAKEIAIGASLLNTAPQTIPSITNIYHCSLQTGTMLFWQKCGIFMLFYSYINIGQSLVNCI